MTSRPHFDDVTVFVIGSDEPELPLCLNGLAGQDCTFRTVLIHGFAPMNVAFQRMLTDCTTAYFIQVDGDMLLRPHAVRRMRGAIENAPPERAMVCFPLHDHHLDHLLLGVKVYRHAALARYPYQEGYSCEVDQIARMQKDGLSFLTMWPVREGQHFDSGFPRTGHPDCLGEHGVFWTPQRVFTRYRRLMWKYRKFGYSWLDAIPSQLAACLAGGQGTDVDLLALLGAVQGMTEETCEDQERDFREPDPAYSRLVPLLGQIPASAAMLTEPELPERRAVLDVTGLRMPDPRRPVEVPPPVRREVPVGPVELNLYVTHDCNAACTFCRRQHTADALGAGDMTPDLVQAVLERFPTIRSGCVCGFGEPLVSPHIEGILTTLRAKGVQTGLITNGIALAEHVEVLAAHRLSYVSVSLNEASALRHRETTGTDTFACIIEGISQAIAAGINVGCSMVVTRPNVGQVEGFLRLAHSLGIRFVSLHGVLPHYGDVPNLEFWSRALTTDHAEAVAALDLLKERWGKLVTSWPTPLDLRYCPRRCDSPFVSLGVDGQGAVSGCRRVRGPDLANGRFDDPDCWRNEYFTALRAGLCGQPGPHCLACFGNWR